MKKLGVIVNPIAGIGGRVGLKGSDGIETLRLARQLGAVPEASHRATEALRLLSKINDRPNVITYPREMGEEACRRAGFSPTVIGSIRSGETTPEDTEAAARDMLARGVHLLLFAGGDGTARNVCNAIGENVPVLGIPAGVKIHSAVYAVTPGSAAEAAAMFLQGRLMKIRQAEVMDIDEEAFRSGAVAARLYGYLRVPEERRYVQSAKAAAVPDDKDVLRGIAEEVIASVDNADCLLIVGPGTSTAAIMESLGLENTLLGVDVVCDRQLLAKDVAENQLVDLIQRKKVKIVVTVIGGQGHVFGRGNQQLSPTVIREVGKENIVVIATREKLASLSGRPLLVDTGDEGLNQELSGYIRVTTGWAEYAMYKVGY